MLYTSDTDRCATTLPGRNSTNFRSEVHRLQKFEAKKNCLLSSYEESRRWGGSKVRGLALRDFKILAWSTTIKLERVNIGVRRTSFEGNKFAKGQPSGG